MSRLRDALAAALSLDTFNRHAEKVDMANVAQLVNNLHSMFLADGDQFVATPNFHVYTLYRRHQGAMSLRIETESPEVRFRGEGGELRIFRLAGSASLGDSNVATVTLVQTHATDPADIVVRLRGGSAEQVRHTVLTHEELNAHNTFERPDNVVPAASETAPRVEGAVIHCVLPPASINRLDIEG
jgi:alpha-N-arabinofuranosidase